MKFLMITFFLALPYSTHASMNESEIKAMEPKVSEVQSARACFKELEDQGCQHPREGLEQFRVCMINVHTYLSSGCRSMIISLYGKE